jgi:hypothetical protein
MIDKNTFVFSTNSSDPLVAKTNPFPEVLEAVLLSERYTTKTSLKNVAAQKSNHCLIISDNGNFSRMSKIAKKYLKSGQELQLEAEILYKSNLALTNEILSKRVELVNEITNICKLELEKLNLSAIVLKQLKCNPDYIIGLEDFTIPVLTMVGLLHPCFEPTSSDFIEFQQKTLALYLRQNNGDYGYKSELNSVRKFVVLHSFDYKSAQQGALLYKPNQIEGIAVSFGAPMASKEYISQILIKDSWVKFEESLPESYLIASALLLGVIEGSVDKTIPIHILGLGSPILVLILGYILRNNSLVSIDATSSFKDADDGNIYSSSNAILKMDMYKVAAYALINDLPYTSKSPYFKDFEVRFPSNWAQLRIHWEISAHSSVNSVVTQLKQNATLVEQCIPYFTTMRKGKDKLIQAVRIARAGSNYWHLQQICAQIRSLKANQEDLQKWVGYEINRYLSIASPKWAKAVKIISKITELN